MASKHFGIGCAPRTSGRNCLARGVEIQFTTALLESIRTSVLVPAHRSRQTRKYSSTLISVSDVRRRAEAFGVSTQQHRAQSIGVFRNAHAVTVVPQTLENVPDARKYVEVGRRADVAL